MKYQDKTCGIIIRKHSCYLHNMILVLKYQSWKNRESVIYQKIVKSFMYFIRV